MVTTDMSSWREITVSGNSKKTHFISNNIQSAKYSLFNFLFLSLFRNFQSPLLLWLTGLFSFQVLLMDPNLTPSPLDVSFLALYISLLIVRDIIFDISLQNQDKRFNRRKYSCWTGEAFEPIKSKDIRVGHILKLNLQESAPADLLLISTLEQSRLVYIDEVGKPGELTQKESVDVTYKFIDKLDLKKLDGIAKVEPPSDFSTPFRGKIQLSSDYKEHLLTHKNFIPHGSTLKASNSLLGLVLYTGNESKIFNKLSLNKSKKSKFHKTLCSFVCLLIALYFIVVLLCILISKCHIYKAQTETEMENIVILVLYNKNIIPLGSFIIYEILKIGQVAILCMKYRVRFNTAELSTELGQIEYCVVTKEALTHTQDLEVTECMINGKIYSKAKRMIRTLPPSAAVRKIDSPQAFSSSLSNSYDDRPTNYFDGLLQDSFSEELAKSIALSSIVTTHEEQICADCNEELALARFSASLGCSLGDRTSNYCELSYNASHFSYSILGFEKFSKNSLYSSVIVTDEEGQSTMFVKGSFRNVRKFLTFSSMSLRKQCKAFDKHLTQRKLKSIVIARKVLSPEQTDFFTNVYDSIVYGNSNIKEKKSLLFKQFLEMLEPLCILGIKTSVLKESKKLTKSFKKAGIKTWIVSHDSSNTVLNTAKSTGVLKEDANVAKFHRIKTPKKCKKVLRKLFKKYVSHPSSSNKLDLSRSTFYCNDRSFQAFPITNIFPRRDLKMQDTFNEEFNYSQVRFGLSIDRISLNTALKDENCKKMLVSLMFAAKTVCFSKLDPTNKRSVVRLLKKNLKFMPSVAAVGNDLGDLPMIKEANVGICCRKGSLNKFCDLRVRDLKSIRKLMTEEGFSTYSRFSRTMMTLIFVALTRLVINFYFLFVTSFTGTLILNESRTISLAEICIFPSVLFLGLFDKHPSLFSRVSFLYHNGINSRLFNKVRLLITGVKSAALGSLIGGVLYLSFPCIIAEKGNESSLQFLSIVFGVTFYIVVQFEVLLNFSKWTLGSVVGGIASVSTMLVTFLLLNSGFILEGEYDKVGDLLFLPLTIIIVTGCSLFCIVLRLIFYHFANAFEKEIYTAKNRLEDFSGGLNKVYRRSESSKEYKEGSLELNPWNLQFYNKDVEELYEQAQGGKLIQTYRLILIICFLGLLIAVLDVTVIEYDEQWIMPFSIILILISILFLLSMIKSRMKYKIQTITLVLVFTRVFLEILNISKLNLFFCYSFPVISFSLSGTKYLFLYISNILNIILCLITIFFVEKHSSFPYETAMILLLLCCLTYNYGIMKYSSEKTHRANFALGLSMKNTVSRNNSILKSLLPEFVLSRVKSGIRYISEDKGIVTVMFCYICDFEKINAEYSSSEISAFLNSLFYQFDLICQSVGVTKIETVGNTYMGCSGLKDSEENSDFKNISQGIRAVQAALDMMRHSKEVKLKDGSPLRIKIGIKTGIVTAGVVGFHKPQFSLVGDTVNTASRLCSTASPFQIQICGKTQNMIQDRSDWKCEEQVIDAKGLGLIKTYLVNQLKFPSLNLIPLVSIDHPYSFNQSIDLNRSQKSYEANVFHLPCKKNEFYKEYRESSLKETKNRILLMQIGLLILFGALTAINYFADLSLYIAVLYLIQSLVVLATIVFFKYFYKSNLTFLIFFILVIVLSAIRNEKYGEFATEIDLIKYMILINMVMYGHGMEFCYVILCAFVILIRFAVSTLKNVGTYYSKECLFFVVFYFVSIYSAYNIEKKRILQAHNQRHYRQELQVSEQLLQNLMPKWVLSDLFSAKPINDNISQVTLLYADIVGFTAYSNNRCPSEVIEMLSLLFTKFDKLCLTYNVYKVYTIGDCYVVMGCIDKTERNVEEECLNVVNMAINMIKTINNVNSEFESNLNMRIGIHTGNISGAITGTTIVRYDIYGTDVAFANKMESEGKAGRIKVSDKTKEVLEDTQSEFEFEYDGEVKLKALDKSHKSYFLIYE